MEVRRLSQQAVSSDIKIINDPLKPALSFVLSSCNKSKNVEKDYRCGFRYFSPTFLQRFATKGYFIFMFSILAIIQGMSYTYFSATLTTLEKRLKITSETATIVMSGNEVSQILFSIPMSYFGGKGHRPRWMGCGVFLSAISCFLLASPHLVYGPGEEALSLTHEYYNLFHNHSIYHGTEDSNNFSSVANTQFSEKEELCDKTGEFEEKALDCDPSDQSIAPLILIFMSQFVAGIGILLFFTLGGPYMDDNMKQTQMPFLMGLTMSFRLIGPVFGFVVGFLCLRVFISPSLTPRITADNPRWIGAWWLGWVIMGSMMTVMSFCIALFPKELRKDEPPQNFSEKSRKNSVSYYKNSWTSYSEEISDQDTTKIVTPLADMMDSLKKLVTNKVNLYNTLAGIFYIFPALSFGIFIPKYIETIYRMNAAEASLISGPIGIGFQAIGLISSGALISKFQPRARKLAGFNVFTGLLFALALLLFTQITCHQGTLGFDAGEDSWKANLTETCSSECNCRVGDFDPVCFKDEDLVLFSPCHAGCLNYDRELGILTNCSCVKPNAILTKGTCTDSSQCRLLFYIFIGIGAFVRFVDSFGRIGNMLIGYRCVDPKQKSLAIGLTVFAISIFASLPSPIIFGMIIDSVCLLWGRKCDGKGNCLLYDSSKFVFAFNITAMGFILIGVLFDTLVWYYVKDLDLYDEKNNFQVKSEKKSVVEK